MKKIFFSFGIIALIISCQSPEKGHETETTQSSPDTTSTLSPEARLKNIGTELKILKSELAADGKYNCCVNPACDWCALKEGECLCHDNLLAKKSICPDCGLGWHNGQGVVEGVKVGQVKWDITHQHPAGGHKH